MPVLRRSKTGAPHPHRCVDFVLEIAFTGQVAGFGHVADDPDRSVTNEIAKSFDVVDVASSPKATPRIEHGVPCAGLFDEVGEFVRRIDALRCDDVGIDTKLLRAKCECSGRSFARSECNRMIGGSKVVCDAKDLGGLAKPGFAGNEHHHVFRETTEERCIPIGSTGGPSFFVGRFDVRQAKNAIFLWFFLALARVDPFALGAFVEALGSNMSAAGANETHQG